MKIVSKIFFIAFAVCNFSSKLSSYSIPNINLGASNILDGGPIRPNPGWYILQFSRYYTTHKFIDECGNLLGGRPSPKFDAWVLATQFVYLSEHEVIPNARGGISIILPFVVFSQIQPQNNFLNITTSDGGFGNLVLGAYLQWKPIMRGGDPFFVHRLEFDAFFPIGKNKAPQIDINPANSFFYIDPHWAATLYLNPDLALSWRLQYLWCARSNKTNIKTGDAIHGNFSFEYQIRERLWLALCGYFLRQIKDDKLGDTILPNTKEQVLGLGPGAAYFFSQDLVFLSHIYFESKAKNRTEGLNFVFRFVYHF